MSNLDVTDRQQTGSERAIALDNLLRRCARIKPGQRVLVLNETDSDVVEPEIVELIADHARELGAEVRTLWSEHVERPDQIRDDILTAIAEADVTIFHHGIGGKLRFAGIPGKGIGVTNLASNAAILDSPWARVPYGLWEATMQVIARDLAATRNWRITDLHGTDISGTVPDAERQAPPNAQVFTLRSFPIGTHSPISAGNARGTLALRWLVSSANHFDGSLKLADWVHAEIRDGRITDLHGPAGEVERAKRFFENVGQQTQQEPYALSSWHAGINPQAFSPWTDESSLNRWQSIGHNNPRTLHFHAVGTQTPGELSLPLIDHTVEIDGETLWNRGRFALLERQSVRNAIAPFGDDGTAFALNRAIGL
jgi:hypothetical protein